MPWLGHTWLRNDTLAPACVPGCLLAQPPPHPRLPQVGDMLMHTNTSALSLGQQRQAALKLVGLLGGLPADGLRPQLMYCLTCAAARVRAPPRVPCTRTLGLPAFLGAEWRGCCAIPTVPPHL